MNRLHKSFTTGLLFILILVPFVWAEDTITAQQATSFVGQTKTVCGTAVSTFYSRKSNSQPTFINIDKPYPNQIFTAVIWGSDRPKFQAPPEDLYGKKDICVTGTIKTYKGVHACPVK